MEIENKPVEEEPKQRVIDLKGDRSHLSIERRLEELEVIVFSMLQQHQLFEAVVAKLVIDLGFGEMTNDGRLKIYKQRQEKPKSNIIQL